MRKDIVLTKMRELNVKPTRKMYLLFAYLGTPPTELQGEEEMNLPASFRRRPRKVRKAS